MSLGGWETCPAGAFVPYTLVVYETVDGFGGEAGAGAAAPGDVPSSTPQPGMDSNDATMANAPMEYTYIMPPLRSDRRQRQSALETATLPFRWIRLRRLLCAIRASSMHN